MEKITLKKGDKVNHEIYGESVITCVSDSKNKKYVIRHKGGIHRCSGNEFLNNKI